MLDPVRIAIRLPDSGFYGRILLGALRAAHARKWIVSLGENSPGFMLRYKMRGIIGGAGDTLSPNLYTPLGIKFIGVLGWDSGDCTASVILDHEMAGRLAGEHLIERGFRDFGFVGYPRHGTTRRKGFEAAIRAHARSMSNCPVVYQNTTEDFQAMLAWLQGLPKPAAVFTADDAIGAGVTEVSHLAGIRVPADVAVVSVNDDGLYTLASQPELSSVQIPWERVGSEAVRLLASHMDGEPSAPGKVIVQPTGLAVRGSSDISVIGDTEVAAAVAYIQQNLNRLISVDDVADATTISRRLLERRFKADRGRTLLEQIQFVRMERAKKLLIETSMRVSDIVNACGFGSRAQFHRTFLKAMGQTPNDFREASKANTRL
jgi:LacI family transcriptional regulator